ncbi:class II fumarate hydratase [Thermocladium modestius]|nr:class II fumarate hydratase [Thermocladium modestius]
MSYTEKARDLFLNTGTRFPSRIIWSMGVIKYSCAKVNMELNLLDKDVASAIMDASMEVINGKHDGEVVLDVFQTGSGTGLNMNINEVIAKRASELSGRRVHPNDHVNMGQSSNDVVPTAIRIAAVAEYMNRLEPALRRLISSIHEASEKYSGVVKAGRTHLRDALPVTLGQELSAYEDAFQHSLASIHGALNYVRELPIGGTAVGTGVNSHPDFAGLVIKEISSLAGIDFKAANRFRAMRLLTDLVELSNAVKVISIQLYRLGQDVRLMFSGPFTAINEIDIPTQAEVAGSSIMPGKTNPVTVEASLLAAAQSIGLAEAVSIASMLGEFELAMGVPLMGYDVLLQIDLMAEALDKFARLVIEGMRPNIDVMRRYAETSPALVTLISPMVGYDKASEIGKMIVKGKTIREALREVGLSEAEIDEVLNVEKLTRPGIIKKRDPN